MAIQQLDLGAVYNTLAQQRSLDLQAQQAGQQGQMNALQMARYQRENDLADKKQSILSGLNNPNLDAAGKQSILAQAYPELMAQQLFREQDYGRSEDGTVWDKHTGKTISAVSPLDGEATPQTTSQPAPRPTLAPGGHGPVPMPVQREELPPPPRPYATAVKSAENTTGNPNAQNHRSTATGDGQFTEGTWLDIMGRKAPNLTQGKSREEILAMRGDPAISARMTDLYGQENQAYLEKNGVQATPALIYGAHHFGADAAVKFAKASPDTPLTAILSPEAIKANPHLENMTVGQARAQFDQRFAGVSMPGQQPQQTAEAPQAGDEGFSRVRNLKALGLSEAPTGMMWVGRRRPDGSIETKVAPMPGTEGSEDFGKGEEAHAYRIYKRLSAKQASGQPLSDDDQLDLDFAVRQLNQSKVAVGADGLVREIKPAPLPQRGGDKQPQSTASAVTEIAPSNPKPTNEQNLNAGYANRLNSANSTFDQLQGDGYEVPGLKDRIADNIPLVGNYVTSDNFQKLEQAQREFVTAQLRRESGAAISQGEFESAKKLYFPQPGDSADVIAQKRASRELAVANMAQSSGPAPLSFKPKPAAKSDETKPKILRFDAQGNMIQ